MSKEKYYLLLSAKELNMELTRVCDQLPDIAACGTSEDIGETFGRRDVSQHKRELLDIVDKLLFRSPTTVSFKCDVRYVISEFYTLGTNEEIKQKTLHFLDPEGGEGIFALPRCKEIEKAHYQYILEVQSMWEGGILDPAQHKRIPGTTSLNQELEQWHKEYVVNYGEEP